MQSPILKYILIFLTLIIAFLSWFSVDRAITIKEASSWLVPTIWFSLLIVFLILDTMLVKENYILFILGFAVLAVSIIFSPNPWHIFIVVFSTLILIAGILRMKKELTLSLKIRIGKIIKYGKAPVVIAFALVISSQYFWAVHNLKAQALIPQVKIPPSLSSKIFSTVSPTFAGTNANGLSVDEFSRALAAQQMKEQSGMMSLPNGAVVSKDLMQAAVQQNEEMILAQGRKQLSDFAGREVRGDEQVSDIFSEIVNSKVQSYITPSIANNGNLSVVPIIFAFIILLTVVSLGSVLGPIWALIAKLIFMLLVKLKVVTVVKVATEAEVIE